MSQQEEQKGILTGSQRNDATFIYQTIRVGIHLFRFYTNFRQGWNVNGDSLSGCVGLICDSCSLFGNGFGTIFFLGSVYAFSSSFSSSVCYRLQILGCGTCKNGFKSSCHHGLLGSAHVFCLYSLERKIHFAHCHHYYNTEEQPDGPKRNWKISSK
uniref:Uncharacterized protein n=1 Tax=Ditylenchus dipsaci TaxID=166011 RepID=A0A915D3Z4_9BILA